jgi:hypothetical protein
MHPLAHLFQFCEEAAFIRARHPRRIGPHSPVDFLQSEDAKKKADAKKREGRIIS